MMMNRSTYLFLTLAVLSLDFRGQLHADDESARKDLYDHLHRSSVEVLVDRHMAGSGCVVEADGTVLTAAHVFRQSRDKIEVLMPDKSRLSARLIALDEGHDLALLQLPERESDYSHLAMAKETPPAGKSVFLFGAPLFRHGVMIRGSVARRQTTYEYIDGHYVEVIHVCAVTAKGVSGGPWVNRRGEVFGVQSAAMSLGDSQQGIAFAAPMVAIKRLLDSRTNAESTTIGCAVEETFEQPRKFLDQLDKEVNGIVLRQVKHGGPAAVGGLKNGEILIAINGEAIMLRDDLLRIIRATKVGEEVRLTILDSHGKNSRQVTLKLTALETE